MNFLRALLVISLGALGPDSSLEPLGRFDPRTLPEASGIVRSRRHPGIFWTHNDSGNPPLLFAVRRDGSVVATFRVAVPNVDWEDIAADDEGHLFLGDIGNNGGRLPVRVVYRLDEPDPAKPQAAPLQPTAASFYTFPRGGRFDAEGLFLDSRAGSAVVVSKRLDGKEAELYSIPLRPAAPLLRPATPRKIGTLPKFVEPATGASLSADGQHLAVCSGTVTRVYRRGEDAWSLLAEISYSPISSEGVTWDGNDLLLASEGGGIDRIAEAVWRRENARGRKTKRLTTENAEGTEREKVRP